MPRTSASSTSDGYGLRLRWRAWAPRSETMPEPPISRSSSQARTIFRTPTQPASGMVSERFNLTLRRSTVSPRPSAVEEADVLHRGTSFRTADRGSSGSRPGCRAFIPNTPPLVIPANAGISCAPDRGLSSLRRMPGSLAHQTAACRHPGERRDLLRTRLRLVVIAADAGVASDTRPASRHPGGCRDLLRTRPRLPVIPADAGITPSQTYDWRLTDD